MTHLEEVHGQVGAVVYHAVTVTLAEEAAALGEEVEGSLRIVDLQSGNLAGKAHDEVAAAFEGLAHGLHTLLRTGVGSLGRLLRHRAGATRVLALQLVAALHHPFGGSDKAYAPSGHGIGLAHAVHYHHAVFDVGKLCHAGMGAHIVDMLIYLIGYHHHALMLEEHVLECLQLGRTIDRACGVAG